MRPDVSDILSSKSKTRVIEKLFTQPVPICLRQIARLCELSLRPTEIAVKDLHRLKVLHRKDSGGKSLYWLNENHRLHQVLKAMFETLFSLRLKERAETYSRDAQSALEFADSFHELIATAKRLRE